MPKRWIREKCIFCSLCSVLCSYEVFKQTNGRIQVNIAKCVDCDECLSSVGCPRRAIT